MIGCVLRIGDIINWAAVKNNAITSLLVVHQFADVVVYLDPVMWSCAFLAKANVVTLIMQHSKRFFFANVVMMVLNPVVYECAFPL